MPLPRLSPTLRFDLSSSALHHNALVAGVPPGHQALIERHPRNSNTMHRRTTAPTPRRLDRSDSLPMLQPTRRHLIVACVIAICCTTAAFSAPALDAQDHLAALPTSVQPFFDADDRPIELSEDELLRFLAEAPIVASKELETGINRTRKLTLEHDGLRVHAVFRTVDRTLRELSGATRPNRFVFRDSYRYEVAAYRLSRALGIHRVPPAVFRTVDGTKGSVQLWIENARTAGDAIAEGLALREPTKRHLQRQLMYGFDQLIFNFDRHLGNILYDQRNRMWFIDHTRSFKLLPQLAETNRPVLCDRDFCDGLRALDWKHAVELLDDALSRLEIDALMKRKRLLLRHFDQLIEEHGADSVLVDVNVVHRPIDRSGSFMLAGAPTPLAL